MVRQTFARTTEGLRDALMAEMEDIREGIVTPDEANAFSGLARQPACTHRNHPRAVNCSGGICQIRVGHVAPGEEGGVRRHRGSSDPLGAAFLCSNDENNR